MSLGKPGLRTARFGGHVQALQPSTTQRVAYTGTAGVISNAIADGTEIVRVMLTSDGYIKFGASPTATNADVPMAAFVPEYFVVPPGGSMKVSAVQDTANGSMNVTEML